jgi:hypothetical protein
MVDTTTREALAYAKALEAQDRANTHRRPCGCVWYNVCTSHVRIFTCVDHREYEAREAK